MRILSIIITSLISLQYVSCRDFYIGMFSRGDFLVAQDYVYKEKRPYGRVEANYGRLFKCKITYFRVVDRLGMGSGPVVKVLKGGLQKNYIAIRVRSGYNLPVSVNIYVGCQNQNLKDRIPPMKPTPATKPTTATDKPKGDSANTTEVDKTGETKTDSTGSDVTTAVTGGAAAATSTNAGDAANNGNTATNAEMAATTPAAPES